MSILADNLFLSVGAMKAGTSWMHRVLATHPDIYFTPEKEIHYFAHAYVDDENPLNASARLKRAKQYIDIDPQKSSTSGARARLLWTANYLSDPVDDLWYRNLFSFRGNKMYSADFSNLYAHISSEGWRRIVGSVGRLRVMYTMRDPIARLWSHAKFHLTFTNQTHLLDQWTPQEASQFLRRQFMWKHAEYGSIVRTLRQSLSLDQLIVNIFEEVHCDRLAWLRTLENFLEIRAHDYQISLIETRVNKSVELNMPAWFPAIFKDDVARIVEDLNSLDIGVPSSWMEHLTSRAI